VKMAPSPASSGVRPGITDCPSALARPNGHRSSKPGAAGSSPAGRAIPTYAAKMFSSQSEKSSPRRVHVCNRRHRPVVASGEDRRNARLRSPRAGSERCGSNHQVGARKECHDRDHVAIRRQERTRNRIRAVVWRRWRMDRDESTHAVVSWQFLPSRPEPLRPVHRGRILERDGRV
jgi:hypothetical protein